MENYIYLDGKKIEISDETAESMKTQFCENLKISLRDDFIYLGDKPIGNIGMGHNGVAGNYIIIDENYSVVVNKKSSFSIITFEKK